MKRVVIIGGSGSGKSTLARHLGHATGLPAVHLDKFFFVPGWIERDRAGFDRDVLGEIQKPQWIMDGNFTSSLPARLARADTFIFLDIPAYIRLWRVIMRMVRTYGNVRPDMAPGCREGVDLKFLRWVIGYKKRGDRAKALRFLENAPDHVLTYHLKSRSQAEKFLNNVKEGIKK